DDQVDYDGNNDNLPPEVDGIIRFKRTAPPERPIEQDASVLAPGPTSDPPDRARRDPDPRLRVLRSPPRVPCRTRERGAPPRLEALRRADGSGGARRARSRERSRTSIHAPRDGRVPRIRGDDGPPLRRRLPRGRRLSSLPSPGAVAGLFRREP